MRKNEEALKDSLKQYESRLKQEQARYQTLKKSSSKSKIYFDQNFALSKKISTMIGPNFDLLSKTFNQNFDISSKISTFDVSIKMSNFDLHLVIDQNFDIVSKTSTFDQNFDLVNKFSTGILIFIYSL